MNSVKLDKAKKKRHQELRSRAEESLRELARDIQAFPKQNVLELIHELEVHQVELELQNDELRRTQSEVEDSRMRYVNLFDFAPVGYLTVDRKGLIKEVNFAAAQLLGVERRNLIDKGLRRLIARDFQETVHKFFHRVFESSKQESCELQLTRNKGGAIDAQLFGTAVLDSEGNATLCQIAVVDITERKQAAQALLGTHNELEEKVRQRTSELVIKNESLQSRYQEIQALHETSQAILGSLDLKVILDTILEKALALGGTDLGVIYLVDGDRQTIAAAASRGHRNAENAQTRYHDMMDTATGKFTRKVLESKQTQAVEDLSSVEGFRTFKKEGARSAIAFPVWAKEESLGVIALGSRTPRKFHPSEVSLLESLGNLMGIAVQKVRLYEQSLFQRDRLSTLHEIDLAVASSLRLKTVLDLLVDKICFFLPNSAVTIRLWNEPSGKLEFTVCRNFNEEEWREHEQGFGDLGGLNGTVLQTRAVVEVSNIETDPRVAHAGFYRKQGIAGFLLIPLLVRDQFLGVLGLFTREANEWPKDEVEFLITLASAAAIAVDNAQLYEETLAGREQLKALSHRLLEAQEAERYDTAHKLYDEVGQELAALRVNLDMSERLPQDGARQQNLKQAQTGVEKLLNRVLNLSLDLRPPILDDFGILAALSWYFKRYTAQTGVRVDFQHRGIEGRFSSAVETVAYRIAQEALTLAARHAGVKEVTMQVRATQETLYIAVEDRGNSFHSKAEPSANVGEGLSRMRERAALVGGQLFVDSGIGRGTRITTELPLIPISPQAS
jgi:PAS domain S-box-containing protein